MSFTLKNIILPFFENFIDIYNETLHYKSLPQFFPELTSES